MKITSPVTAMDAAYALCENASGKNVKYNLGKKSGSKEFLQAVCDFDYTMKMVMNETSLTVELDGSIQDLSGVEVPAGYAEMISIRKVYTCKAAAVKQSKHYWKHEWNETYRIDDEEYVPNEMSLTRLKNFLNEYNGNQFETKMKLVPIQTREDKLISDFANLMLKDKVASNTGEPGVDECLAFYLNIQTPYQEECIITYAIPSQEVRSNWLMSI